MNLKDKKLLLLGGAAFIKDIRKYANESGFKIVLVGSNVEATKKYADEVYAVDTQNVDRLEEIVKSTGVSGIFVGAAEINIKPAIELSKRTGIHFYTNENQWDILSNKRKFKQILNKHGIGTIPCYDIPKNFTEQDLANVDFPVLVKPVDGSGAHGITVAQNAEQLRTSYDFALKYSPEGDVLVEKLLLDMDDTFIRYHFQDGIYSISSSFDRHSNFSQGGFGGVGIGFTHPTRHLKAYIEKCDKKMQEVFKELEIKNGMISLQCFADKDENFYFYEGGYRLGGSQSYIFTDAVNNSNTVKYMVNCALTGSMADFSIAERDNPFFTKQCCNIYVGLKAGTITVLDGVENVRAMKEVLNVTEFSGVGTVIEKEGNLNQVCMRLHVMAETKQDLSKAVDEVYNRLSILDENGNDMILEKFKIEV